MSLSASDERAAALRHVQRASGQIAALAPMIAAGKPFPPVAQQVLAARGSLDSLLVRLLELELRDHLPRLESESEFDGLIRTALGRNAPHSSSFTARGGAGGTSHVALEGRTTR